tara:strand:+ start:1152 stop:1739 length:588 start_codon:yes stop_codon:yes gene_type:complete
MALVLTGAAASNINLGTNGTITGLAVGGVPDGTIDTDAIAVSARGKILQIVAGTPDTTYRTSTSTSFVTASSTCNVAITPTSASSKILVICKTQISCNDGNDAWAATIYRDSTNLGVTDAGLANGNSVPGIVGLYYPVSMHYVDSPSTTSSITYQLRVCVHDLDADGYSVNIGNTSYGTSAGDVVPSTMYAMEFA